MDNKNIGAYSKSLMRPVDASTLGAVRILFGLTMAWSAYSYFNSGAVKILYTDRQFHFAYEWSPWITPFPGDGMYYCFAAMGLSALLLA